MGRFLSVKEAGRKLRVKPRTIRAWIRDLQENDPELLKTHSLTHPHPYNASQVIYELEEEFLETLKTRQRTHLRTHKSTHFEGDSEPLPTPEKKDSGNPPEKEGLNPELLTQMFNTLTKELEAGRETLNQVLQDNAKERERTAVIIMQLRGDIRTLNDKLLTAGKGEPGTEKPEAQEPGKEEPPESPKEDIRFTFGDRIFFLKEDIKRVLHKKIF